MHNLIHVDLSKPPTPPFWSVFLAYYRSAVEALGGDVDAANKLYGWVKDHPAFEDVEYGDVWWRNVGPKEQGVSDEVDAIIRFNIRVRSFEIIRGSSLLSDKSSYEIPPVLSPSRRRS